MDRFVICENIRRFTRLLDPERDEHRRHQIEALLLEEKAKLDVLDAREAGERPDVGSGMSADAAVRVRQRLTQHARTCRLKAEELRTAASGMRTAAAAQSILRLARDYDLLAERAEARLAAEEQRKAVSPVG